MSEKMLIDLWDVNMDEVDTSDCTDIEDILSAVITYLSELPTVDAVEVVRCKDCKHGMKSHLQPSYEERQYLCRHSWEGEYHKPDHFCSYGERKDNES